MTAIEALLARPFVTRFGWGLLHSTWEVAALAVVAGIALWFLRRGSPQSRYLVACATLVLMVLSPVLTVWLIGKGDRPGEGRGPAAISLDRQSPDAGASEENNKRLSDEEPRPNESTATHVIIFSIGFEERVSPLLPWLVVAWGIGVLLFSTRLLGGWFMVQRLARRGSHPVGGSRAEDFRRLCRRMAVSRPVRLLESTTAGVPMVVGWIRPIILMPAAAMTGLTAEQFLAILAHELAHVRRLDYLVNLVQSVAETLLFYHPGVWWLGRRIREEREHCCDDLAVATCGDGLVYAKALAAMEEMRSQPWALAPSAAGKPLLGRIRRLLGVAPAADRPAGGLAGVVALGSVAALGLLLVVAPVAKTARADVPAGKSLAGVVSNPDGKPAGGVDLWLVDTSLTEIRAIVLGKAQSGDDGQFRVDWDDKVEFGLQRGRLALWAYRNGAGASRVMLKSESTSPDPKSPVRVTLVPAAESTLRVLDPEGKPISGATIGVIYLHEDLVYLPDELVARLASTTDPTGMAVLKAAPDAVEMVRVTSPAYGVQIGHFRDGLKPGLELRLRPVARVEGRVSATEPSSAKGLKVLLSTYPTDQNKGEVYGRAEATTDDQGRFTVPALATGELSIDLPPPRGSLDRALRPAVKAIAGPGKVEIEIPLKRLVSVRGVVREKETGRPVPETTVRLSSREAANVNGIPPTRTDAEGRFTALALPGARSWLSVQAPSPYLRTMQSTEVSISETDGQTLPPIEVERGATLRGRVVDDAGVPVPDATVEGKWKQVIGPSGTNGGTMVANPTATASTDARGDFLLVGINPGATVSLEARTDDARTEGPLTGQSGAAEPVTLKVSRSNIVALSGRVVDATGRPVGNARVRIRSRATDKDALMGPGYLRFEDSETIRTAADGSYRTPRQVHRGYAYSAEADIDGGLPAISPWLRLDPATEPTLADVTLTGLRIVRGRVVDGKGQPVTDAIVRVPGDAPSPIRTRTDDQGRFTLTGVLEGPAFLFVEKAGYRFQGYGISARATDVTVALMAESGPPPEPLATLPPAIPRAEELALLHRVLDPYADKVLKQGTNNARAPVLAILTRIEPARLIGLINQEGFGDARAKDSLRGGLARRLIREQPVEALAMLEAIQDPSIRSYSAYDAAFGLPSEDRDRKLDLLGRGLVAARTIADPAFKAVRLALIGEQYFDLGEVERATNILKEAEAIARDLPKNGRTSFARGAVAEELSPIDLPAALALLEGTEADRERDQHLGHIAHELAGRNPAEAERVLMMIKDVWPNFRDNYTQRVCHGMAAVDRERALRLAASMTNYRLKARAYGVIALKIAPTDRPAAARLIAEAFAILDRVVEDGKDQWDGLGTACTAAAGLLPIIEEVDPKLLREYVWRTLALRPPLHGADKRDGIADLSNAQVAATVARYDRESARAVLEGFGGRAIKRFQGMTIRDQAFEARSVFTAAAVVDPAWAVARVEGLPGEDDLAPGASKTAARLAVAEVLSSEGAQRWSIVEWSLLHLWRVGTELY